MRKARFTGISAPEATGAYLEPQVGAPDLLPAPAQYPA